LCQIMIAESAETTDFDRPKWLTQFNRSLRRARAAIRKERTYGLATRTVAIPLVLSALWVAVVRFTLLDLPVWPAILFPLAWLAALAVASGTMRVSLSEAARFLDHHLGLDERMATCVQMLREVPIRGLRQQRVPVPVYVLEDTARQLRTKAQALPRGWHLSVGRREVLSLVVPLLVLLGAALLPTPLDQIRSERAELQRAVNEQMAKIETLRANIVARPGLDEASKAQINQQLLTLEQTLQSPPVDRSNYLAAITDAQSKLQDLSSQTPNDFAGVTAAAKTVQSAAVDISRNAQSGLDADSGWDPAKVADLTDLGKAADAANVMSDWMRQLATTQISALAGRLGTAQEQALAENSDLGHSLLAASNAVAAKDVEQSRVALKASADQFLAADKGLQLAQAVQQSLASLDDSRQTLAKAGAEDVQKGQVGFRRPGVQPEQQAARAVGTPGGTGPNAQGTKAAGQNGTEAGNTNGVNTNGPSALDPNMGSNSPDYSLPAPAQAGSNGSQTTNGGGPPSSQSNGQGGSDQTGGSQGSNGGQPGNTAGGGTGGGTGSFGGQSTGPVGGSGGAISQVANPTGQGIATQGNGGKSIGSGNESLYVPTPDTVSSADGTGAQTAGQGAPDSQNPDAIQGRGNTSGDGTPSPGELGTGTLGQIRTPYKQVIGDYAEKASQALDKTYVPADAKQYVKDYFTELGK
jgi:hypothetical protein